MNDKKKWLKLLSLCGLCLLVVISGCTLLPSEDQTLKPPLVEPAKVNFDVVAVKRGSIAKQISSVAVFVSSNSKEFFFKASGGRLLSLNVKLGDSVKRGDVLAILDSGDLQNRIDLQKITLKRAKIILDQAKAAASSEPIRLSMVDVEMAQTQLNQMLQEMTDNKLVASMDGIVTFINSIKNGDPVEAYKSIVSVADPKQLQLNYEAANAADISTVQVGMEVDVKKGNDAFKGHVLQTPLSAGSSQDTRDSARNAKLLVIGLDTMPEGVVIGNNADIVITTEKRDDILIIPRSGLRSYLGRDYVQVLEGESRKEVGVEKGIVSATEVEIRQGVKEGQKVILNN